MARKLPSLNALRAFEAAGRHLSFTHAAHELFITQGAVSRHVRSLERELGVALFVRKTRAVALTEPGAAYLARVRDAFDLVDEATRALVSRGARRTLKVSLLASFAAHWLAPRLGQFSQRHPEIELVLHPTIRLVDLASEDIDVAIRYGDGGWPGVDCVPVMTEELFPVCSPRFLARHPIARPGDVCGVPILHSSSTLDWKVWSEAVGVELAAASRQVKLHDYNIVLEAAVAGHGVAMGRHRLIGERLRTGSLTRPLAGAVPHRLGYHVLTERARRRDPAIAAFRAWLVEAARMTSGHASSAQT
jgi:LysR family glycine cleavage system transcriptional activator